MFVQIKDEAIDILMSNELTKNERRLFWFLVKQDRFGDRFVKLPTQSEIAEVLGVCRKTINISQAKLQELGLWDFSIEQWSGRNLTTPKSDAVSPKSYRVRKKSYRVRKKSYRVRKKSYSAIYIDRARNILLQTNSDSLIQEGERIFEAPETTPEPSASLSDQSKTSRKHPEPTPAQTSAAVEPFGKTKRPINSLKGTERSIASDAWMTSAHNPDEGFVEWLFKKRAAEGSKIASLVNAAAEICNNYSRAKALWDEYQQENRRREEIEALRAMPVVPEPATKQKENPIPIIDQIKNRYLPLLKFPAMKKNAIASIQNLLSRCSESERTEINLIPEMRSLAI